jgi:GTPase SAR1 family protein
MSAILGLTADNQVAELAIESLVRHMIVAGTTGTGKTSFLKRLIADSVGRTSTLIFDPSGDYQHLGTASDQPDLLGGVTPKATPIALWGINRGLPLRISLCDLDELTLRDLFQASPAQMSIYQMVLNPRSRYAAGRRCETLRQAWEMINGLNGYSVGGKPMDSRTIAICARRVESLEASDFGKMFGPSTLAIDTVLATPDLVHVLDIADLFQAKEGRTLYYAVVKHFLKQLPTDEYPNLRLHCILDEAHTAFADRSTRDLLRTITAMGRKSGVGMTYSSQSYADIPRDVGVNCATTVQFCVAPCRDTRAIREVKDLGILFQGNKSLNVAEILSDMLPGESLMQYQDTERRPMDRRGVVRETPDRREGVRVGYVTEHVRHFAPHCGKRPLNDGELNELVTRLSYLIPRVPVIKGPVAASLDAIRQMVAERMARVKSNEEI